MTIDKEIFTVSRSRGGNFRLSSILDNGQTLFYGRGDAVLGNSYIGFDLEPQGGFLEKSYIATFNNSGINEQEVLFIRKLVLDSNGQYSLSELPEDIKKNFAEELNNQKEIFLQEKNEIPDNIKSQIKTIYDLLRLEYDVG